MFSGFVLSNIIMITSLGEERAGRHAGCQLVTFVVSSSMKILAAILDCELPEDLSIVFFHCQKYCFQLR